MRPRLRARHVGYILGLVTVLFLAFTSQRSKIKVDEIPSSVFTRENQVKSLSDLHPDVKIVPSVPPPKTVLPPHECVPLPKSPKEGVQICMHPLELDRAITKALTANRLWESDLVFQMQKALQRDERIILLDIGCNIGVYTLWAAAMGNRVIAVDMLATNIHLLQASLYLNRLSKKVTLINNGIYRDHRTLETIFFVNSMGASRLNTSKPFKVEEDRSRPRESVRTICLDDLVPLLQGQLVYMKMDIENTEHHALACADQLFNQVNVKVVQMEWHRRVPEESVPILNFMSAHGYVASLSSIQYTPIDLEDTRRRMDIFFLKKSEFRIH